MGAIGPRIIKLDVNSAGMMLSLFQGQKMDTSISIMLFKYWDECK